LQHEDTYSVIVIGTDFSVEFEGRRRNVATNPAPEDAG